jgi:acetyltransferase-like isoleucine patch superfamily enzyme
MNYALRLAYKLKRWIFGSTAIPTLRENFPQYSIGKGSYGPLQVISSGDDTKLTIGAYTSIAPGAKVILGSGHRTDWVTTYPFNIFCASAQHIEGHPSTKGDVLIGSDVWIAADALIMSGVTIGDGAVIGARAVVSKDVPPYAIVVGNPARIVKYRFGEQHIAQLLKIKWWAWEEGRIERAIPMLLNIEISQFIDAVEAGRI